jgi:hypothetical protein
MQKKQTQNQTTTKAEQEFIDDINKFKKNKSMAIYDHYPKCNIPLEQSQRD